MYVVQPHLLLLLGVQALERQLSEERGEAQAELQRCGAAGAEAGAAGGEQLSQLQERRGDLQAQLQAERGGK